MANTQFNNTNFAGKNVLFLQGSQDNLNNLITSGKAVEGAFYLTNDTHRLYIGRSLDGKVFPVAVNEGVVTVQKTSDLHPDKANAGEFYFVTEENILCVFNGSHFIQINHDTNTKNASLTTTANAQTITDENGKNFDIVTINTTVTDTDGTPKSHAFKIKDSSGAAKITTETIADNNVAVVDIKSDTYKLSASNDGFDSGKGVNINLKSANNPTNGNSNIQLKAGDNVTIVNDNGNITINSEYKNTTVATATVELTNEGKIAIQVTDTDGNPTEKSFTNPITYTVDKIAYVPGSTLPVYSKSEIDNKFRNLNGLTYRSVISEVPSGKIAVGDMWMATADIDFTADNSATNKAITAYSGDLIIASGTEDTNPESENYGFIINDLKFSVVPSGNDVHKDTTYIMTVDPTNNAWSIKNRDNSPLGSIKLQAPENEAIEITSTNIVNNETSDSDLITTIKHADISAKKTEITGEAAPNNQAIITAVTDVIVNNQGHVTEVVTTDIGIKDSTYALKDGSVSAANITDNNNKVIGSTATVTTKLVDQSNNPSEFAYTLKSSTLSFSAETNTNNVVVDLTWGSF